MENGHMKTGFFSQKVEPYLRPISDIGIGFYNLDENTAKLRFQLSNDAGTLLISDENLKVYGYFESSNGSVSDVIELNIVDELNGIVEITLDQDFLHASTSTKVKGQLYIGVQNVSGKPEYNEVAVLGEFTFEVADALINKISSFTKIEYIRMFSQLKAQIEKEVRDIQDAIKNGADYVAEMNTVKEQGITQINKTVTEGKTYIDNVIAQAKTDLNNTKDDAIGEITTTSNNAKTSVTETADGVIKNINNVSNDATEHIDGKVVEFNGLLETEGFLTPEELGNQLDGLEWQKYKLTNDDGTSKTLTNPTDLLDTTYLDNLSPGLYYAAGPTNSPNGASGFITVMQRSTIKIIYFQPYNQDRLFVNRYYNEWSGWKELTNNQYDTGWVTFDLINGAKSNTAYKGETDVGFDCAYRTITNGSVVTKKLRINGTNLTPNQVVAQLPSNFAKNAQAFPVRVPNSSAGGYIVIRPSGRVNFYVSGDSSNWTETGYAYGECTWND